MLCRFTRKQASGKTKSINQEINETKPGLFGSTDCGLFKKSIFSFEVLVKITTNQIFCAGLYM